VLLVACVELGGAITTSTLTVVVCVELGGATTTSTLTVVVVFVLLLLLAVEDFRARLDVAADASALLWLVVPADDPIWS